MKKVTQVVAAVIRRGNRVFATERGYGRWKGFWEFPGGKVERGETQPQALSREIREELNTDVQVLNLIATIEQPKEDEPDSVLEISFYECSIRSGQLELLEAEASGWLAADECLSLDWLPADRRFVEEYIVSRKN